MQFSKVISLILGKSNNINLQKYIGKLDEISHNFKA